MPSLDIYLYTTQSKLCFTINFISGRTKGEQLASGNASKSTAKYESMKSINLIKAVIPY